MHVIGTPCPKENNRFINPHSKRPRHSKAFHGVLSVLLWKMGYYDTKAKPKKAPDSFVYPLSFESLDKTRPSVKWINHCTFLVKMDGINMLTDPIWSERCSPLPFGGPIRRHAPPLELHELPRIDVVLISHNHYDHLDKFTVLALHRLFPDILWLVPYGVKKWFVKLGIDHVEERGWWESVSLTENLKATGTPTQHFSGRTPYDLNQSLWMGWVVENTKTHKRFYFAGDSGYNPHDFKAIGKKWKQMDLSLIPIGTYEPYRFLSPVHISPQHAVQIHQEVGSLLSVAMHWKTFRLSDEPLQQPPYELFLTLKEKGISPSSFLVLDPGYEINW